MLVRKLRWRRWRSRLKFGVGAKNADAKKKIESIESPNWSIFFTPFLPHIDLLSMLGPTDGAARILPWFLSFLPPW